MNIIYFYLLPLSNRNAAISYPKVIYFTEIASLSRFLFWQLMKSYKNLSRTFRSLTHLSSSKYYVTSLVISFPAKQEKSEGLRERDPFTSVKEPSVGAVFCFYNAWGFTKFGNRTKNSVTCTVF